jgi:uncharacterized protein (TIGR01244 family)
MNQELQERHPVAETGVHTVGLVDEPGAATLRRAGYTSVINLRLADEAGAGVASEAAVVLAAGLKFIHLPLSATAPDAATVERFLDVVSDTRNAPAFIHCRSGNRAAALFAIKRVVIDHWTHDRARREALEGGLTSDALWCFAVDQMRARGC